MVDGVKSRRHRDGPPRLRLARQDPARPPPCSTRRSSTATPSTRCARPTRAPRRRCRRSTSELVEKGNMRIIGSFFQGTRQLTSKEKVLSPKDMAGKKYRGVPVKLWSSMLTGMGAVATPVEVSELATALATGLVRRPGEPAAEHLQPQALRGAEVRHADRPHAVGAVGVRQREGVAGASRRATARSSRTRWSRSARRRSHWDKETFDQVPQGSRGARA